jgi:5-formyltetrahydrofolate cyclo-ligase
MPAQSDRSKQQLRAAALAARDALSGEQRAAAARAIALRGLPVEIARGTVVAGYSPIRGEIDPAPLMRELATRGALLALPVITARGQSLRFRVWSDGDRLLPGPLGSRHSTGQATASATAPDIMTGRWRNCANPEPSRPSALASRHRKLRPYRRCCTTWRWIMC